MLQHCAAALAPRLLAGVSWSSKTQEAPPFETEEDPSLPPGPVVGVGALKVSDSLLGHSSLFLKDKACFQLNSCMFPSHRIQEA